MSDLFCTHLDSYGQTYEAADDAYQNCLGLMDTVLAEGRSPALVAQLLAALDSWEKQTRNLRSSFTQLTEKGRVLLPRQGQNTTPVCAHCGQEVPRLAFAEFVFEEDGTVLFRGRQLLAAESVPA